MPPKKACLTSFGCQMNEYDTGRLADLLTAHGWRISKEQIEADFIFFNTCSIREKAAQRVLNHLEQVRSLKKRRPGLIIGVGGCVAEQEGEKLLQAAPWLDLVVGPQHLPEIPQMLENFYGRLKEPQRLESFVRRAATGRGERPAWSRENLAALGLLGDSTDRSSVARRSEATSSYGQITAPSDQNDTFCPITSSQTKEKKSTQLISFVTIMQGCNNYCAYCVVPYLRGPELSRAADDIVDEIKRLIDNGVKDITLLGQNVNSYGKGLPGSPSFPDLLEKVAATGIERLRFTTSHPKDLSSALVKLFGTLSPLCENLHLPVQSGSDKILKDMRRVYTRDSYLRLVDDLRAQCPGLAISTDIIVGFPGETDGDFEDTLSLIKAVGYDAMFSFKYSDRPQTASIAFENKVEEEEKGRRLTELQILQKEITLAKNAAHIGQVMDVLVERESERYAGQLTGRARNFKLIHFDASPTLIGQTVPVRVEEAWGASLRGVRV